MAQTQVYNGYVYYRQPNGDWKRGEPVEQDVAVRTGGMVLPDPPPTPPQAPGRTPAGAATEGAPKGFAWVDPDNPSAGVYPIAGLPAEARDGAAPSAQQREDRDRISRINQLVQQIKRTEQLYRAGPGQTSGLSSLLDYLPTDTNTQLDVAGAQLSQQGLAAFRIPGTGTVSDRDAIMFDRANLPAAAKFDAANEEILRGLKSRVEEELKVLRQPAPQWGAPPARRDENSPGNALDMIRTSNGSGGLGGGAAPRADLNAQQFRTNPNPALARAHDELVRGLIEQGGGRLDPEAYAQGFARLAQDFGVQDRTGPGERAAWAQAINRYLDTGGRTIPTDLTEQQLMTAGDILANNVANNPVGGALAGAANGISAGLLEGTFPGGMAAMRDAQGIPTALGEIGGTIGASYGIGAGGRVLAGRLAPALLGGGNAARLGRAVAPDVAYGALYGNNTEGDPLTGATFGAAGSLAGQGLAHGLGATVGGLNRTAAAQALLDRGVPVSVARQLGLGRVEDVLQSLPLAGDASRARQADSFVGFNQAAFQEGGKPIGANIPPIAGRDGLDALNQSVGGAYDAATRGVTVDIGPHFTADFGNLTRKISGLPGDYQAAARQVIQNRVAPAVAGGQMTGETYQQAIRGLRAARSNADNVGNTGFEQDYREVLGDAENMLTGAMMRGGGQQTIDGLARANEAYGNFKILEDAALNRAKVGTRTGEVNVFTPSQLLEAARKSEAKFGNGAALRQLGEQGQEVLPSTVPNSGTTDRAAALALLAGAGGIGGGLGLASDQSAQGAASGAGTGLGTLAATSAILGLLGTRGGQKALEQILITRPQVAQRAGQGVRRSGGLFGRSGASLALQGY
jgi:hypothetical protein